MKPERPCSLFEGFYRNRQTAIAGVILAGKMTDLLSAFDHLCAENEVSIPEGMRSQMEEIESIFRRIESINSLPLQELLRLPPLELSPLVAGHPQKPLGDGTESLGRFCSVSG